MGKNIGEEKLNVAKYACIYATWTLKLRISEHIVR